MRSSRLVARSVPTVNRSNETRRSLVNVSLSRSVVFVLAACALLSAVQAGDERPYLGSWSNGRGETLTITAKTIRFAEDDPVAYRDVTRATDGSDFELQITSSEKINGFPGKTLAVHCEEETMEMTGYASHAAFMQGGEVQMQVTWDRDTDDE